MGDSSSAELLCSEKVVITSLLVRAGLVQAGGFELRRLTPVRNFRYYGPPI